MKNSDMKVIAIILSIALLFTVVTSNVVSIASVIYLSKGGDAVATNGDDTANNNNASNNNAGNNANTNNNANASNNAGTNNDANANSNAGTNNDANANNNASNNNQNTNNGGAAANAIDLEALNMFRNATKDIKANGTAGYKNKNWQEIESINIGNEILANIIKGFVTGEADAAVKDNAKGTDDAKNRMPEGNFSDNVIASCKKEEVNGNYKITVVFKDQVNPTADDTDGIVQVSRDLLYIKAVTDTIESNDAVKAIVRELETAELNYKAFTVTAEMTKDGKFISITHECHAELKAKAKLLIGSLEGDGVLCFRAKYWDFQY